MHEGVPASADDRAEGRIGPKPPWLKKTLPKPGAVSSMRALMRGAGLHTVCESALCPNLGECFERHCATFMIMGDVCTRHCRFCAVTSGVPEALDVNEPDQVAEVAARLKLHHVVVTSVTRDDLPEGGAVHFAATIRALRERLPEAGVEVLIPDFRGDATALETVLDARPQVLNHNVETTPRLYSRVRPEADYERSLELLRRSVAWNGRSPAAVAAGGIVVKSGFMVGLGETQEEVRALLVDLAEAGVDVVTIGQYLRPSAAHVVVAEYVPPETFKVYRAWGETDGLVVEAAPFVRSSFCAEESYKKAVRLRERRASCWS